ncbi:aldehyde ferredoxin oxidoreductase N-terminal domain-containing protein [Chloroflexota bacterium]
MRYAETGVNLEIDLSQGSIDKVETDPKLSELFLGGQGTADKILWDRVPPDIEPFSPENLLIFSAGILCGTPVPGANRTIVNTFSPPTYLHAHSVMGGFFAPEMKHAGYDKIVISGKASNLVYLWINDDKVEIRDASHLQGKGARETAEILREELKDDKIQVAAIGLAGENKVFLSTIEHGNSASAARGAGVIMGDKKLKAIAVRGTKDINIAKPAELFELCGKMMKEMSIEHEWPGEYVYGWRSSAGDPMSKDHNDNWHTDNFAWGNARTRKPGYWTPEIEAKWGGLTNELQDREMGCYNCPKNCIMVISSPGRQRNFIKCFNKLTYAMASHQEIDFSFDILAVTQELGLDGYGTPTTIALGIELYEAGILTDKDLPGFPTDTKERFFYLIDKIAKREDAGDALADGSYWAARKIGNGAEEYEHNSVKKQEQVPIKLGTWNRPYFLMYCTGSKQSIPQIEGSFPQIPLNTREEREEFVKTWDAAPDDRFKQWFIDWEPRSHLPLDASCNICDWNEMMHYIDDATGICAFVSSFRGQFGGAYSGGRPPFHINNLPEFIRLATGMDIDKDELWEIAKRNRSLVRAHNIRRGLQKSDEKPPDDQWRNRDPEIEVELLDMYYDLKGWNNEGIPTKETLTDLGLDYVGEDLEQRGYLKS